MKNLRATIQIENIEGFNQHIEKLQYLIKEVKKEVDLINKFKLKINHG